MFWRNEHTFQIKQFYKKKFSFNFIDEIILQRMVSIICVPELHLSKGQVGHGQGKDDSCDSTLPICMSCLSMFSCLGLCCSCCRPQKDGLPDMVEKSKQRIRQTISTSYQLLQSVFPVLQSRNYLILALALALAPAPLFPYFGSGSSSISSPILKCSLTIVI